MDIYFINFELHGFLLLYLNVSLFIHSSFCNFAYTALFYRWREFQINQGIYRWIYWQESFIVILDTLEQPLPVTKSV